MKCLLSARDNRGCTNYDVESRDNKGRTAFHLACIYGHYDVAKTLLSEGNSNPMVNYNFISVIFIKQIHHILIV